MIHRIKHIVILSALIINAFVSQLVNQESIKNKEKHPTDLNVFDQPRVRLQVCRMSHRATLKLTRHSR